MSVFASNRVIRRRPLPASDAMHPGMNPVLSRVYASRGILQPSELDLSLNALAPPDGLLGLDAATNVLVDAVTNNLRIAFIGDYDADGATACALGMLALRSMGARRVSYLVPNRFEFGYGLTPEIVELAQKRSRPDLLITVDNGIASLEGTRVARERGMSVVITDHHLPGAELPDADAIVNPNQPGDTFTSRNLAGVGVIFYVMAALRARLRSTGWFSTRSLPNLSELLDLVALGTVADVVPLDRNNRILVAHGLERIRMRRGRPGILALLKVAGRDAARVVATDLGFAVAPRLNAAGRLEDMAVGIECLLCDSESKALTLATRLDTLNRERRTIEAQMQEQAVAAVSALDLDRSTALPPALCLHDPSWHQGLVGIIASRIREQIHRPVIALAPGGNGELKGSGRSVPGVHIRDALERVAIENPDMLSRFGGHAMAAGLTLREQDLERFQNAFADAVREQAGDHPPAEIVFTDGALDAREMVLEIAELLRDGGPWGAGFPEPRFEGEFEIIDWKVVGEAHLKMKVEPAGGTTTLDAIAFRAIAPGTTPEPMPSPARLIYRLDVNDFNGRRTVQLIVDHVCPMSGRS